MTDSHAEGEFVRFMGMTIDAIGDHPRFILGVSDTTSPDADFGRILKIRDMVGR